MKLASIIARLPAELVHALLRDQIRWIAVGRAMPRTHLGVVAGCHGPRIVGWTTPGPMVHS